MYVAVSEDSIAWLEYKCFIETCQGPAIYQHAVTSSLLGCNFDGIVLYTSWLSEKAEEKCALTVPLTARQRRVSKQGKNSWSDTRGTLNYVLTVCLKCAAGGTKLFISPLLHFLSTGKLAGPKSEQHIWSAGIQHTGFGVNQHHKLSILSSILNFTTEDLI